MLPIGEAASIKIQALCQKSKGYYLQLLEALSHSNGDVGIQLRNAEKTVMIHII